MATGWNLQQVSWWKSQKVKTKTKVFPWLFSNTRYGYGAEHILSMRVVLADGRIAEVTPEKTKVSQSRSSGKNFPSRFSSHGQARCSTRRTITSSLHWEELDPATELSHSSGDTNKIEFTELCVRLTMSQVHRVQGTRDRACNPSCLGRYLRWPRRTQGCRTGPQGFGWSGTLTQGSLVQTWKNHCSMPQASPDYSIVVSMVNYLFADFWKNILASPIYRSSIKHCQRHNGPRVLTPYLE